MKKQIHHYSPAQILGRLGGSVKSERKAITSQQNGKLGGRPRKNKPQKQ